MLKRISGGVICGIVANILVSIATHDYNLATATGLIVAMLYRE